MEKLNYKLPMGKKILKKKKPYESLTDIQKKIHDLIFDPINGPLEFAEHCCYANKNGIIQYIPYDYQREMLYNLHNYSNIIIMQGRQQGKCIEENQYIKIKNKKTNEIKNIKIKDFFELIKI